MSEPNTWDYLTLIDDLVIQHGTKVELHAWAEIQKERDDLRASLRDMVEYAEKYLEEKYNQYNGYTWDGEEQLKSDISKARELLG